MDLWRVWVCARWNQLNTLVRFHENIWRHTCIFWNEYVPLWAADEVCQTYIGKNQEKKKQLKRSHNIALLDTFWHSVGLLTLTIQTRTNSSNRQSPKHSARGVVQSPEPIYRRRKACLFKRPSCRAAGDSCVAYDRSRVRANFFSILLSSPLFFCTFPTTPVGRLGLKLYFQPSCAHLVSSFKRWERCVNSWLFRCNICYRITVNIFQYQFISWIFVSP